jgi:phage terminase large subunit-like protein
VASKVNDHTTAYAKQVVAGKILTGKLVRQACQRHLDDLRHGSKRGLYFDVEEAERRIDFARFVKHYKGEWAGCAFEPEPWECFIIGAIFGWKRKDGMRRFRTVYIAVAKKNGKTFLSAFIGLNLFLVDGEAGAEVYSAATKREQAKLTFGDAQKMIQNSPQLRQMIGVLKNNLNIEINASKWEPLTADAQTLDGPNIHGLLVDEFHAHKTGDLWNVTTKGRAARRQPMTVATTTAGNRSDSICKAVQDDCVSILNGRYKDDSLFAFIAMLDEGDDWRDEKVWRKANPNLGISPKLEFLREECARAKRIPSEQNDFMRLHMNVWTQQETRWLDMDHWAACGKLTKKHELAGVMGYGGMDLSQKIDLSAFVLLFPFYDEGKLQEVRAVAKFWLPEARANDEPWHRWAKDKLITLTPGNVVDFDFIESDIVAMRERYLFEEIAFDPWTAHQSAVHLGEDHGFKMIECRQGYKTLSEPSKELERQVVAHIFNHGGNPVLTYMADAVAIRSDENGNIRPVKDKSSGRIDGILAAVMAEDRLIRHEAEAISIYDKRGFLVF